MLRRVLGMAVVAAGGYYLTRAMGKRTDGRLTSTVEQSIEVNVPVRTAYNQWTQFEDFPQFMENVQEVRQVDDTHLHWRAKVAGKEKEWDAEITEQIPDQRIAWRGIDGVPNAGVVTFHRISDTRTRIMVQMDYQPEGVVEQIGGALGAVKAQTKADLNRLKQLLESRGSETGAWRGKVTHDTATSNTATTTATTASSPTPRPTTGTTSADRPLQ